MTQRPVTFVRMLPNPVPRVARMIRYAAGRGMAVEYIGAHRSQGLADEESVDGVPVTRVGSFLPSLNGKGVLRYISGILKFNAAALRVLMEQRPVLVHFSDLETAPSALLYRLLTRSSIMYNIHDNYADRYAVGRGVRAVLNATEGFVVLLASVSVVPEPFRRSALPGWCRSRVLVVPNAPEPVPFVQPVPRIEKRPVSVAYAGWIDGGRGVRELIALADAEPALVSVQIAGDGSEELIQEIRASRASYLGTLSHPETLALFGESDFVAAIYGPSRPINRMAAPNKVAEALALGRPVITNCEVLMLAGEEFDDCVLRVPYAELSGLADLLRELQQRGQEEFARMCVAARDAYEKQYSWVEQERAMANAFERAGLK